MRTEGRRAASTAATRSAIIEAGRELLATREWRSFTLEAVASKAGVSRVTIYNQMQSKYGLLDAVLTELTERAGMDRLLTATSDRNATAARFAIVQQTCRFWHVERDVLRPLFGLAAVDQQVAATLADRERWRRDQWEQLLDRLIEEAPTVNRFDRPDLLAGVVAVTSFPTYDALGELADDPVAAAELIDHLVVSLTG